MLKRVKRIEDLSILQIIIPIALIWLAIHFIKKKIKEAKVNKVEEITNHIKWQMRERLDDIALKEKALVEKEKDIARREVLSSNREVALNTVESRIAGKAEHYHKIWQQNTADREELEKREVFLDARETSLNRIARCLAEQQQSYPWTAQQIADILDLRDQEREEALREQKRPAIKAADAVKQIRAEKKALQAQCKMLEYQLNFYETMFPWLEDFKLLDPKSASRYAKEASGDAEDEGEYERLKNWLSPEEYSSLSSSQKYQLALNRYARREKTSWEIGRDYERYVGYMYEQAGFRVTYSGALHGLEDMGRDLIVQKPDKTLIVQCKYWSASKTIHEKHIFQLYGSVVHYQLEHPSSNPQGIFVTSTDLSPLAQKCADYLGIKIKMEYPKGDYPQIKCNISKRNGEKIYHLPFDQQYDRVVIEPEKGEFYALTTTEAEAAGFRRAWKWHPGDD